MRPWAHKTATSVLVTAIAYGGIAGMDLTQPHPHAAQRPPAQAQGGHSPAPSTSASPAPSAGHSVAHSAPPATVSPIAAMRYGTNTAALMPGAAPSPATSPPAASAPPGPTPAPTPAPTPGRSPSCTVNVTLAALRACARIGVQVGG